MAMIPRQLGQLAGLFEVETSYEDVHKKRRTASVDSLLSVLRVLGAQVQSLDDVPRAVRERQRERAQRGIEPVIVVWDGRATEFELILPEAYSNEDVSCTLRSEAGGLSQARYRSRPESLGRRSAIGVPPGFVRVKLQTPAGVELGYHRLTVETGAGSFEACVISAPMLAYFEPATATWGCFLPLYALRTDRNWGAGDFTDLAELGDWVRGLGGGLVGTLPLLAAFLDDPCEPSPYAPASRLFWNEFYIDVAHVPELDRCAAAREILASGDFQRMLAALRDANQVNYRRIMVLKRQVLELLAADCFAGDSPRSAALKRFTEQHRYVRDYAAFRAVYERRRQPWQQWPSPLRDGQLPPGDYDQAAAAYHCYVQWVAREQLQSLADGAAAAGDGLYLDLPVGVRPDSYDVWRHQHAYVDGASAGAPPDAFFTNGQNWNFPPQDPDGIRRDGYRHVREYLGHHMQLARTLRIDHVMGLHRLYWIPAGMPANAGVYVRYRPEELYAVLCLESQRHRTTIIGENLGTVAKEVNESLASHGLRRMFVVQYEFQPDAQETLASISRDCVASLNTHDMPTFAAWWRGTDIPLRRELGLLDDRQCLDEQRNRRNLTAQLNAWLKSNAWLAGGEESEAGTLASILKCLAASAAESVLVNLEDLWLETQPQNVPGTGPERPNWKHKAAVSFSQFARRPDVLAVLQAVGQLREQPEADAATPEHETI